MSALQSSTRTRTARALGHEILTGAKMENGIADALSNSVVVAGSSGVRSSTCAVARKKGRGRQRLCEHLSQEQLGRIGGRCAGRIGDNKFVVGYVKDTRSRCQYGKCADRMLEEGTLRVGKRPPSLRHGTSKKTTWYHCQCAFAAFRKCARKSRTIRSIDDIDEGFEALKEADQALLMSEIDDFNAFKEREEEEALAVAAETKFRTASRSGARSSTARCDARRSAELKAQLRVPVDHAGAGAIVVSSKSSASSDTTSRHTKPSCRPSGWQPAHPMFPLTTWSLAS